MMPSLRMILANGYIYRTSMVKEIHEISSDHIHFETENTHYHLFLSPYPAAIIRQFPLEPAACASWISSSWSFCSSSTLPS